MRSSDYRVYLGYDIVILILAALLISNYCDSSTYEERLDTLERVCTGVQKVEE